MLRLKNEYFMIKNCLLCVAGESGPLLSLVYTMI